MSLGQLTSSVFLYCTPTMAPTTGLVTETVTATVTSTFTKVYTWTAPAACPTGEWLATYTIKEICTGDPKTWTQPAIPPNFIKTVVTCNVCDKKTKTITCPVEKAAQTGDVTIQGNGITATPASVPAQATGGPDSGAGPGPGPGAAAPVPGAGPGSGSMPNKGAGGDSPAAAPLPAPNNNNGNAGPGSPPASAPRSSPSKDDGKGGPGSAPAPGSGSSPASGPGSGSGPGAAAPADGPAGGMAPTVTMPKSNAATDGASSPYVTAGAPSLKSALLLVSGMFVLVSGSIVC
ncbi:hypothetical protein Daus18300_000869 [Diaporthe australafricana]|uniref:Uncharacterized protein n=1 Tax=Diaporthe australafricana TaxID=127596 RepID=A0ABR3Y1Q5_9PEZI